MVKPPSYRSGHSQIITWIDIDQLADQPDTNSCNIEMSKLPNHFIWDDVSKNKFRGNVKINTNTKEVT